MNGRPYRVALGRYHRVSHASHMTLKASVLGVATYLGNVDHLGGRDTAAGNVSVLSEIVSAVSGRWTISRGTTDRR